MSGGMKLTFGGVMWYYVAVNGGLCGAPELIPDLSGQTGGFSRASRKFGFASALEKAPAFHSMPSVSLRQLPL